MESRTRARNCVAFPQSERHWRFIAASTASFPENPPPAAGSEAARTAQAYPAQKQSEPSRGWGSLAWGAFIALILLDQLGCSSGIVITLSHLRFRIDISNKVYPYFCVLSRHCMLFASIAFDLSRVRKPIHLDLAPGSAELRAPRRETQRGSEDPVISRSRYSLHPVLTAGSHRRFSPPVRSPRLPRPLVPRL